MSAERLDSLIARLSSGDAGAAEEVFRSYEPYLRKVVRRQLSPRLRAKFDSIDIVQSVWADVVEGFRKADWKFRDTAQLRAFLVKLTRNRFIDRLRQHRGALERERPLPAGASGEQLAASRAPRPSEAAQGADLWEHMLGLCPREHHELLRLKRAGYSLREIADRTGLHEGSVRRILRRLAQRLALQATSTHATPRGAQPENYP